ncbi:MAG: hypothetical protein GF417_09355 [Candidatus Latescibacteria bacterium]|nr:hypothetical protein [bacterium]MBD3424631.1 hypothetical protein [Candidatus Latescibacterota bacterium]
MIERLVIAEESTGDNLTDKIISNIPDANVIITDNTSIYETDNIPSTLFLTRGSGRFIKDFPAPPDAPPAREKYIITMLNCPFCCSYCYLQVYLEHERMTVFTNVEDIKTEVREVISRDSPERMTTGEMGDSLAIDHITGTTRDLLPLFSGTGTLYEARTKSSNIGHLLAGLTEGMDNLLITWTMGPAESVRAAEPGTSSLTERLKAISAATGTGIKIGIRLDPVIPFFYSPGLYKELLRDIADASEGRIYRFEIGIMRFPPGLWEQVRTRYPGSVLMRGEYSLAPDGKIKYFRPLRLRIYREIYRMIKEIFPLSPVELSMEPYGVWHGTGIPIPPE